VAAKITTFLMFDGRAGEALEFYTSLFSGGAVLSVARYGPGEPGAPGSVKHARFTLAGQDFMCIDSAVRHDFTFNPAISLYVECDDEEEIDRLYAGLAAGGGVLMPLGSHGIGAKFGWVSDRFGVSWQLALP
jgi:predicted 3-demethylubiquinone-9 3-methyltransferase (glyoxalase superfamily)